MAVSRWSFQLNFDFQFSGTPLWHPFFCKKLRKKRRWYPRDEALEIIVIVIVILKVIVIIVVILVSN